MTLRQWRVRVTGKPRDPASIDLLVAAIMALGEQFAAVQRQTHTDRDEPAVPAPPDEAATS